MKNLMLAAAAAGFAMCAAPAFAQAPNDAAATLRQGKAYSNAKLRPAHLGTHSMRRHATTTSSRTSAPNADNSADQLNAKQLHSAGGS